ncbi:hypothetical protein ABZY00_30450 [Streptomyces griseoflavus]|uniref:hypothetical protein n=1 Tax=Streptomyces griseoflavus TaxID=35619 RepID=UPI0033A4FC3F
MRIVLFLTCFNDTMFPDTGYRPEAVPLVERFTRTFAAYDAVVTPSASRAGMIRDSHPVPARNHGSAALQEEVAGLGPRVHEFTKSLTDVLGVTDVEARFPHRVAYRPRLVRPPRHPRAARGIFPPVVVPEPRTRRAREGERKEGSDEQP